MSDRRDRPHNARRDGEAPGSPPTLLDVVRAGGLAGSARVAGSAQPSAPATERVLYVHPTDLALVEGLITARPTFAALAGVRIIVTPLVGLGGVAVTQPGDVDLAGELMRSLDDHRLRPPGSLLT